MAFFEGFAPASLVDTFERGAGFEEAHLDESDSIWIRTERG